MEHCLAKIRDIIARKECDRRALLQLGYNLGRLSELSGGGRELCWDPWKEAVVEWDLERMGQLAQELQIRLRNPGHSSPKDQRNEERQVEN